MNSKFDSFALMNPKNTQLNRIVGINIRRLRIAQNLSQEEFALKCGLHRTYVGAIERGERNITLQSLEQLAATLSVSPYTLLIPNKEDV